MSMQSDREEVQNEQAELLELSKFSFENEELQNQSIKQSVLDDQIDF